MIMIGQVENAMLARLRAATTVEAVRYKYPTLETWPKRFDEVLSSETTRYPAAWTAFGGAHKIERVSSNRWRAYCVFGLVVAAQNLRNEQATRHGGSQSEPGSYQLATDAVRILAGQTLGLDINPLEPTSILEVETPDVPKVKQLSIYAVSFDTSLYFDAARSVGDINDFALFHADWDPAPFGHVDPTNLPAPIGEAIVSDNISLRPVE